MDYGSGSDQDSVAGGWDSNQHLTGSVDDVRVYHRALSKLEVELLYHITSPNHFVNSAKDIEMIWVEPGLSRWGVRSRRREEARMRRSTMSL